MTISIIQIRKVDLPGIIAFFNVELDTGNSLRITLYGLRLVRSNKDKDETFVGFPQRQAKDSEKYYNHFYLSPALTELIHTQVKAKLAEDKVLA